ncbi:uncharacterized protein LOC111881398 [Lactuca sativa]|uniref:uncharacterized protein LOC111881398 n=1 Tax=Lactuca sativa TaxID=4236 RepID=UPI0022AEA4E2|nr:uncharacterized protein LOC111881398 [Lactuca sativa]
MNFGAWNIRGLNKVVKQKEVNNLDMCGILESHVSVWKLKKICDKIFKRWDWVSNCNSCIRGTRIIVGWNVNKFDLMVLGQSNQVMHCMVRHLDSNEEFYVSFIYAASSYLERRFLWSSLVKHKIVVYNKAWVMLGDFNVALKPSEYSESTSRSLEGVDDFIECINAIEVEDIKGTGFQFTWTKSPSGECGLLKKLDRIMVNFKFLEKFSLSHAIFKPYRISDHSPTILSIPCCIPKRSHSFKFVNFIVDYDEFLPIVEEVWRLKVAGGFIFNVTQKLKLLKKPCRRLFCNSYISGKKLQLLRDKLDNLQVDIDNNPHNLSLRREHAKLLMDYYGL